ncbi:MAG: hypothetical protein ACJASL_000039 [Paraglaciecola sp.]|jgi:hypothetical protein
MQIRIIVIHIKIKHLISRLFPASTVQKTNSNNFRDLSNKKFLSKSLFFIQVNSYDWLQREYYLISQT